MTDTDEIKFAIRYLKNGLHSKRTPPLYELLMKELGFVKKDKVQELEKENAELKKQQFSLRNERNTFLAQNEQYEKDLIYFNENLTKAKELLKKLYLEIRGYMNDQGFDMNVINEVYDFIKCEVEK